MNQIQCQRCGFLNPPNVPVCSQCNGSLISPHKDSSLVDHTQIDPSFANQVMNHSQHSPQSPHSQHSPRLSPQLKINEHYFLIQLLGQGGMSEVWEVFYTPLKSKRALKFLLPHLMTHPTAKQRLIREAQVLANMNHSNVIHVYDVFEYNHRIVISMELINEGTLGDYIQRHRECSVEQTIEWTKQILKGLSKIHKNQLIHRDIKPGNILLKQTDEGLIPVITDLGVVQDQKEERLTRIQSLIGTLEYLSPEQIKGEAYDHRVDLYALGIMMYEMLTGDVPFLGNDFNIQRQHIESFPDWSRLSPQVPTALISVMQKALHKDMNQRFESSKAFLNDLKRVHHSDHLSPAVVVNDGRVVRETQLESHVHRFQTPIPVEYSEVSVDHREVRPPQVVKPLHQVSSPNTGRVTVLEDQHLIGGEKQSKAVQEDRHTNPVHSLSFFRTMELRQVVFAAIIIFYAYFFYSVGLSGWFGFEKKISAAFYLVTLTMISIDLFDSSKVHIRKWTEKVLLYSHVAFYSYCLYFFSREFVDKTADIIGSNWAPTKLILFFVVSNIVITCIGLITSSIIVITCIGLITSSIGILFGKKISRKDFAYANLSYIFTSGIYFWLLNSEIKLPLPFILHLISFFIFFPICLIYYMKKIRNDHKDEKDKLWLKTVSKQIWAIRRRKFILLILVYATIVWIKTDREEAKFSEWKTEAHDRISTLGIVPIKIPGGSFNMGSENGDSNEKPVHRIKVKSFYLSKTEVTVGQYRACVKAGACSKPSTDNSDCNWDKSDREDHPINCVDWNQARMFAKWVGGDLPSEAQWEYAARSGGKDWKYPWGNESASCEYAVMNDGGSGCGKDRTWAVCSKPKGNSKQGLCDMAGGVWEWVRDEYQSYDSSKTDDLPVCMESSCRYMWYDKRVRRGGSWSNVARIVRAADRFSSRSSLQNYSLGFRLLLGL